jgi:hypothetical protein
MITRRGLLAAGAGLLAACAAPGPARRAASATSDGGTLPFPVIDALPDFFRFWERAGAGPDAPLARQVERFRREVVASHRALYARRVLGLPADQPEREALERRLAEWLPRLPVLVPRMRQLHAHLRTDLEMAVARFRQVLGGLAWTGPCYFFASIDSMNGGFRPVDGEAALLFGLDVIAAPHHTMPLRTLLAHELFHGHQTQLLPSGSHSRISDALWSEGLATYASTVLAPGTTDAEALPASHRHDPAHPQLDNPARRVSLAEAMPAHAADLGRELLACLDSQQPADYAVFFLGRAHPRLGERPVRSAYWFGLQVVRRLAASRSLAELARVDPTTLRADIRSHLEQLIRA